MQIKFWLYVKLIFYIIFFSLIISIIQNKLTIPKICHGIVEAMPQLKKTSWFWSQVCLKIGIRIDDDTNEKIWGPSFKTMLFFFGVRALTTTPLEKRAAFGRSSLASRVGQPSLIFWLYFDLYHDFISIRYPYHISNYQCWAQVVGLQPEQGRVREAHQPAQAGAQYWQ